MNELLQIQCTAQPFRGMSNRAIRLIFDSQENQSDEVLGKIASLTDKIGWLCFLPGRENIQAEQVMNLPAITPEDGGKSPAQRMRGVLFRIWEQKGKDGDFETYYKTKMGTIIDQLKEKLT